MSKNADGATQSNIATGFAIKPKNSLKFGSQYLENFKIGPQQVSKIYQGSNLMFNI
jgi:hypothetical protein